MPTARTPSRNRATSGSQRDFVINMIPAAAVCAEIGVWKATFSERVAAMASPREYHLIDPWKFVPSFPRRMYGGMVARSQADMDGIHEQVIERMKPFPGIVIHRKTSAEAAASFPDRYFDWIYIDGDHSYEAAKADLEAWFPKVKPGGIIVTDDYNWKDEAGELSVKRAADEFVQERGLAAPAVKAGQCVLVVPS